MRRAAPNLVSQGITTVVVNQDGRSPWPIADSARCSRRHGIGAERDAAGRTRHGAAARDGRRCAAAGASRTRSRGCARSCDRACRRARSACRPGSNTSRGAGARPMKSSSSRSELPAVNGIYISHERSEGSDPLWYVPSQDGPERRHAARRGAARPSRSASRRGARVVASHLKAKGEHYWGSSAAAVESDPARARSRRRRVGRSVSVSDERHRWIRPS